MFGMHLRKNIDFALIWGTGFLLAAGLLFLSSASHQRGVLLGKNFTFAQAAFLGLALFFAAVLLRFNYQRILSWSYLLYGLSLGLLLLLEFIAIPRHSARRWLDIGGFSFQPSEFVKITLVLVLARILSQVSSRNYQLRSLFPAFLLTFLPFYLVIRQPDLGTSLVYPVILVSLLFVWGMKRRHLWLMLILVLAALPFIWQWGLADYQKTRLLVFLNPNLDPMGAGYTINQSKIAIGSGMFFGKGYLAGTQSQLNFLPESYSDFVYAAVAEEWGFLGAGLLAALFLFIIRRSLQIAERTRDTAGRLLVVGLVSVFAMQVIVNIGMTMGILPVVGLPLPLVSYGGSSLVTQTLLLALILNVGKYRPIF